MQTHRICSYQCLENKAVPKVKISGSASLHLSPSLHPQEIWFFLWVRVNFSKIINSVKIPFLLPGCTPQTPPPSFSRKDCIRHFIPFVNSNFCIPFPQVFAFQPVCCPKYFLQTSGSWLGRVLETGGLSGSPASLFIQLQRDSLPVITSPQSP